MQGSFTFKWDCPAKEVYVTGSFDAWSKSIKLDHEGGLFSKVVRLPVDKTLYKFVVDGTWTIDPTAPIEVDSAGVENNVLHLHDITVVDIQPPHRHHTQDQNMSSFEEATISTAGPEATTAALAGAVPKEKSDKDAVNAFISSAAPESTTAQLAGDVPKEVSTPGAGDIPGGFPETPAAEFMIDPMPASTTPNNPISLAPGQPVPKVDAASIHDGVKLDQASYENADASNLGIGSASATDAGNPFGNSEESTPFSVNPIPASDTATNPISLKPGEPVPTVGTKGIHDTVKLDKESYEQADASNLGVGAEYLGVNGAPMLPEVVTPAAQREKEGRGVLDLPPITDAMIPESSLPITGGHGKENEAPMPNVVKDSLNKSGMPAEAAAVSKSVENKHAVEQELKGEVPVAPATTEGAFVTDKAKDLAVGAAAAAGLTDSSKTGPAVVPSVVKKSQAQAHAAPEAAAVPSAVEAKKEMESELKSEVPTTAPAAETSIAQQAKSLVSGLVTDNSTTPTPPGTVPGVVKESQAVAHTPAEASGVPESVEAKSEVEAELKSEVSPTAPAAGGTIVDQAYVIGSGLATAANEYLKEAAPAALTESTQPKAAVAEPTVPAAAVPGVVKDSLAQPGAAPEASGVAKAVAGKQGVEAQIAKDVKTIRAVTPEPDTPLANAGSSPPVLAMEPKVEPKAEPKTEPKTRTSWSSRSKKSAEIGGSSSSKSKKSAEIGNGHGNGAESNGDKKREKRRSFFGKLKEKFHFGTTDVEKKPTAATSPE